jgi:acyl-CoA thioester hydrolase
MTGLRKNMARLVLELPEIFAFRDEITVHISEINHANHVGADGILTLLNEARIRFLTRYNYKELDIEGYGIIIADAAVIYKSEAFHGDVLEVEITVRDFSRYGCDFVYRLTNKKTRREVARANTRIVFFDYQKREKAAVPAKFKSLFLKND